MLMAFDRRPIKMGSADGSYPYCVSSGNAQAAYLGILVYNEANNASVFFPSAGRRQNKDSSLNLQDRLTITIPLL